MDRELTHADVYVSAIEGTSRSAEVLAGLESASGFPATELSARVEVRAFPKLRLSLGPNPGNADHIEKILADLRNKK
jgi:ribosome-binding factor A